MAAENNQPSFLEFLPVSLFGIVMSMTGLSFAWEWSARILGTAEWIRLIPGSIALLLFIVLTVCYILKWRKFPDLVAAEFEHPVLISFFGTFIISLLLIPGLLISYSMPLAVGLWTTGAILMLGFTGLVLRKWLDTTQNPANAVPAWIIPVVGTLDIPIVGYRLPIPGIHDICLFAFSIGLIFAIILMTIIIARLLFQPALATPLQPTLLILVGPFALAFSGYVSISGTQDMASGIFFYFDIFLLLILGSKVALLPRCCPFNVSWWSVAFPLVAITIASFRFVSSKTNTIYHILPLLLLSVSTITIIYLMGQSVYRLATRQFLLPKQVHSA